jgi:hypothetical protein
MADDLGLRGEAGVHDTMARSCSAPPEVAVASIL